MGLAPIVTIGKMEEVTQARYWSIVIEIKRTVHSVIQVDGFVVL